MIGKRSTVAMALVISFSSVSLADEVTYLKHIKPVLDARCTACHGPDSPEYPEFRENRKKYEEISKGPRMDTYAHVIYFVGWPDTGALMRRLDDGKKTKDGKPGNMYEYLGDTEKERQENLKLFKDWVGNWTLKRWDEITKDDLNQIKIKY